MKLVYLKTRFQSGHYHSLYKEIIEHPPSGYEVFTDRFNSNGRIPLAYKLDRKLLRTLLVKEIWLNAKSLFYVGAQRVIRSKYHFDFDLLYASQQLIFDKQPWVVDFEFANAIVGYGNIKMCRNVVQRALASNSCKKILPWSNWAKGTLFRSLECRFKEKIETVHPAIAPKNFVRKINKDRLRLLFVGSTNPFNVYNFELKGGNEAVNAFIELNKKYDGLELAIRSWVPPEVRAKCSKKGNIKILHFPLNKEKLARLYASSDIFMFPSHTNLGMAILEAMSYELPVIALGVYDVPEAVEDLKTGVLLSPPRKVPYCTWNGGPNHYDGRFLLGIRHSRPWLVKQIVEKTSLLIEEGSVRRRIGREARRLIEHGNFSIEKRNEKLKKIFDEATEM